MRALQGGEADRVGNAPRRGGVRAVSRRGWLFFLALGAMAAAPAMSAAPTDSNQVIVPNGDPRRAASPDSAATATGSLTIVAVVVLAAAGGLVLWRGRGRGLMIVNRAAKQLNIEETRGLGNRQYLVVATYQDKKFLLAVCPGRIDFLAPLTATTPPAPGGPARS